MKLISTRMQALYECMWGKEHIDNYHSFSLLGIVFENEFPDRQDNLFNPQIYCHIALYFLTIILLRIMIIIYNK